MPTKCPGASHRPDLLQGAERYPRENDADEKRLTEELLQAASLDPRAAVSAVLAAADRHAARRKTRRALQGRPWPWLILRPSRWRFLNR